VEGALSERLIVQPAERHDHGGYHEAAAVRPTPDAIHRTPLTQTERKAAP
jgi:hypothetical protein